MANLQILLAICTLCMVNYAYGQPFVKREPLAQYTLYSPEYNGSVNHLNAYHLQLGRPMKVFFNGYNGTLITPGPYHALIQRYIELGNIVMTVDFIQPESIVVAHAGLPALTNCITRYFKLIGLMNLVRVEDMHFIGFSLSAQVAGLVAGRVNVVLGRKIGRITALNPTRIGFESVLVAPANKLDPTDAHFVEIIHTDIGASMIGPGGHVDFYPNGGTSPQPGCQYIGPALVMPEIPENDGWSIPVNIDGLCSFMASRQLLRHGAYGDNIQATKCDSWENYEQGACQGNEVITFGENVNQHARGKFFFSTPPFEPYP